MPSMRLILTVGVISLATVLGVQHYQKAKGG
jgi:hypothetical protein